MEYFNNILCVEAGWLISEGILTKTNYDALKLRGILKQTRKPGPNTPALISYDSIPDRFKSIIVERFGDPYKTTKHHSFAENLTPDSDALEYYSRYMLTDGRKLPKENITEYCTNAMILNAVQHVVNNRTAKRKALGGRKMNIWERVIEEVAQIRDEYNHTLPANMRRFREKFDDYKKRGYDALIHKGFCNENRRKVTQDLEQLFLSLYCLPNKPASKSVHELYMIFLGGELEVPDVTTGEIYQPEDFYQDGKPIMVSESTVWNYINNPLNRALVDAVRSNAMEFNHKHRPHHHRNAPEYTLSKISLDDRDLPRKMHDGQRVKAYYAYDIKSRTLIGVAYSKSKNRDLFIDCIRNMFVFLSSHNLGVPMELEVEHHLVNTFKNDLMKAGVVFPFIRWCAPGNSQEKYAEIMIANKKYGFEKKYQDGIGRFYAKNPDNVPKIDKVFDEKNNTYKSKTYSFEELVADDLYTIQKFNESEHPLFKGKRRIDVLLENVNPNLANIDRPLLARYIGDKTETSIRRSQYVNVQNAKYQLTSPSVLAMLEPNNYKVAAYYIPDSEGIIDSVFLYQNDAFICECEKIITYNTATAEQTDIDLESKERQAAYVKEFDMLVRANKPAKVIATPKYDYDAVEAAAVVVETKQPEPAVIDDEFDYNSDDEDYYAQIALKNI